MWLGKKKKRQTWGFHTNLPPVDSESWTSFNHISLPKRSRPFTKTTHKCIIFVSHYNVVMLGGPSRGDVPNNLPFWYTHHERSGTSGQGHGQAFRAQPIWDILALLWEWEISYGVSCRVPTFSAEIINHVKIGFCAQKKKKKKIGRVNIFCILTNTILRRYSWFILS